MIREVVRTRRMPPWHADPDGPPLVGDLSLAPDQARALVQWIEAGAPRGEGPDPLQEEPPEPPPEWPLGPPDVVVLGHQQMLPASGVIEYRYDTIDLPFDEGVWVRAADLRPSNPRVLHHALSFPLIAQSPTVPNVK